MRVERVTPGRRAPARLAGAILTRDLTVGGRRWSKGRRLSSEDLLELAAEEPGAAVTVLVPTGNELHEDEAALRLAKIIAGQGLDVRGPNQSRLDLVAAAPGVVTVRIAELERINRLDPLEVFTVYDGQVVEKGDLVASVKVAPHLVDAYEVLRQLDAVHDDSAALVRLEPVDAADERGLAGTRRPANDDALAALDAERDVAQDVEITEPLVDALHVYLKHRFYPRPTSTRSSRRLYCETA